MTLNPPSSSNMLMSGFRKWNSKPLVVLSCPSKRVFTVSWGRLKDSADDCTQLKFRKDRHLQRLCLQTGWLRKKMHTRCRVRVLEWRTGVNTENSVVNGLWIVYIIELIIQEHWNLRIWAGYYHINKNDKCWVCSVQIHFDLEAPNFKIMCRMLCFNE